MIRMLLLPLVATTMDRFAARPVSLAHEEGVA
jgi:hypothetical protein